MLSISPLAFYDNIQGQNHRKCYAFGQIYPLIISKNRLIPFQLCLPAGYILNQIYLVYLQSGKRTDITSALSLGGLTVKATEAYTLIKYPGSQEIVAIDKEGQYYLELNIQIESLAKKYYSEVFTSTNNTEGYIYLEYANSENLYFKGGVIDFSNDFCFSCYLPTQIGKPKYVFEEEGIERFGYTFIESQVSKKVYNFTALMPEFLCDALRLVRMCNKVQITEGLDHQKVYDLIAFEMEPDWQEQGDVAAVKCSFETDTVLTNVGGYQLGPPGFNNDFNEDYERKEETI